MLLRMDEAPWTLSELAEEVAAVLRGYEAAANGQVRAVPDERSIRYYTTLGLLDRPAAMRGRTALYGKRHLAQVVAIKRMQAAGRSLADIADVLPTIDDTTLGRVSGVAVPRRSPPPAARPDFWRSTPAQREPATPQRDATAPQTIECEPAKAAPLHHAPLVPALPPARVVKPRRRGAPRFSAQVVLELAPGVTIAIDPGRTVTDADADAIVTAARPLVAELRRRHLISAEASAAASEPQPSARNARDEEEPR
jgi:DNA-binding transcriptional MerR regulator